MLFNSVEFLFFFPIVTLLFFLLPHKFRWSLLLTASCFFYMFFKPVYILILAFTIVVDYFAGLYIEKAKEKKHRKFLLGASLVSNIGVLAIFKYYNFINDNISVLAQQMGFENHIPYLSILLPIGLSFHTFQAMSYNFEIYYGRQKAEKNFGIFALYVMFYPQLVAGPIERPQNVLHQFHEKKYFSYKNAVAGLNLIALGLFKKMIVADRVSVYVNEVYGDIGNASTISTLLAICFFSIQIYCDFSGYSDIALGSARFMGYHLMLNFDRPYTARSMSEFWTRWHISLSTWFKDYLYIPLGGNKVVKWKWLRNLAIIFLVSGLWHGANWTFIIWGALHAFYLIFGILTKEIRDKIIPSFGPLEKTVNQFTVFVLVSFAWIFFRAENFSKAGQIIGKLTACDFSWNLAQICAGKGPFNLLLTFFAIGLWLLVRMPDEKAKPLRNVLFLTLITFLIIILGNNGEAAFIYFQF